MAKKKPEGEKSKYELDESKDVIRHSKFEKSNLQFGESSGTIELGTLDDDDNSLEKDDDDNSLIIHSLALELRNHQLIPHNRNQYPLETRLSLCLIENIMGFDTRHHDVEIHQYFSDFLGIITKFMHYRSYPIVKSIIAIFDRQIILSKGFIIDLVPHSYSRSAIIRHLKYLERIGFIIKYSTKPILKKVKGSLVPLEDMNVYGYPGLTEEAYEPLIEFLQNQTNKARRRKKHKTTVIAEGSLEYKETKRDIMEKTVEVKMKQHENISELEREKAMTRHRIKAIQQGLKTRPERFKKYDAQKKEEIKVLQDHLKKLEGKED